MEILEAVVEHEGIGIEVVDRVPAAFDAVFVDEDGHAFMTRQTTKKGDYVDLLALMDVLAVPNVCGADVMKTSNFALKP